MMSATEVRDARLDDARRLAEIYADYVKHTAVSFEYVAPTPEEFAQRMRNTLRRYPWLVVEEEGRVWGYACAGPFNGRAAYDWSCETTIYLDRAARGRGLGRRLYEALEERLRGMGIRNLYACVAYPQVEDAYLTRDSANFHARLGYAQVGRFHACGCKFGRWYDVIWMEKQIGEHRGAPPGVRFACG